MEPRLDAPPVSEDARWWVVGNNFADPLECREPDLEAACDLVWVSLTSASPLLPLSLRPEGR